MTPATVGAYHNFIPLCTIVIAHLTLDEPLTTTTVTGALIVMVGTELVRRAPFLSVSSARDVLSLSVFSKTCSPSAPRKRFG